MTRLFIHHLCKFGLSQHHDTSGPRMMEQPLCAAFPLNTAEEKENLETSILPLKLLPRSDPSFFHLCSLAKTNQTVKPNFKQARKYDFSPRILLAILGSVLSFLLCLLLFHSILNPTSFKPSLYIKFI